MAEHIPFITSQEVRTAAAKAFGDSEVVRLAAYQPDTLKLPSCKLWIDPAIDGVDEWSHKKELRNATWISYVESLDQYDQIVDSAFWRKPDTDIVAKFVRSTMARCLARKPDWITVPQLPLVGDSSRNKINRALATATGDWRAEVSFGGRLILPVVITHQNLVNTKTARNPRVTQAEKCFVAARAHGIWVVENDLDDDSGARNMRDRIASLVQLHEELNAAVPATIRIAGPYWGANLVLWSRGLVNYPAIGVGGGFQYTTSGGMAKTPKPRVALSPLRRIAGLGNLPEWLDAAMATITPSHPAHKEFLALKGNLPQLQAVTHARMQVADFYKKWFGSLATMPAQGRAMAMFQDLSSAYALGKKLPPLDRSENSSRKPQAVAEPLMMNCL